MHVPETPLLRLKYAEWADEYLKSLPLEHFMESTPQATQRKITLASLEVVHGRRPEIQVFNELLVQYPIRGQDVPGRVVPDNMVVVHDKKIKATGSFDIPLQPVGPYWTLEYVSKTTKRKDYDENHRLYERDLKVPFYLTFYPDDDELTLFRLSKRRFVSVKPNAADRYEIPDLEIEVALLEKWVRFWHQGELVPLPAELDRDLAETRLKLQKEKQRADLEQQRADGEKQRADDLAKQVEELARQLAELRGNGGNGKKKK